MVRAAQRVTSAVASTMRPVNKKVETVPGGSAQKRKTDQWARGLRKSRTFSNPWPRRKILANPERGAKPMRALLEGGGLESKARISFYRESGRGSWAGVNRAVFHKTSP